MIFTKIFGSLSSDEDLKKFNYFILNKQLDQNDKFVVLTKEKIKNNIFWMSKNYEDLKNYFGVKRFLR